MATKTLSPAAFSNAFSSAFDIARVTMPPLAQPKAKTYRSVPKGHVFRPDEKRKAFHPTHKGRAI